MKAQFKTASWKVAVLLVLSDCARAVQTTIQAQPYAGSATTDLFPPTGTVVNSAQFPPESKVGFTGPTPTGAEPQAVQAAKVYPYNGGHAFQFPLTTPEKYGNGTKTPGFDISTHWGNLSPWYSVPSSDYGLKDANPLAPEGCSVTQMHLLYRHGARYPTSGSGPSSFAKKVRDATKAGLQVSGELAFLGNWTYKLGAELLTPFGRSQVFMLGVAHRQLYGHLLNNFTRAGKLPVFRTQSQDRMVKSAVNFAAGFFGVPEYLDQVSIELLVETSGVNNSGAPYDICKNANVDSRSQLGGAAASKFAVTAFDATRSRLQAQIKGITFSSGDIISMLQMCAYETVALGWSDFCTLFTEEDFVNLEYYFDITYYYNNGPGSPVSAAQGKGYLDEFLARATGIYPLPNSGLNETFDNTSTFFPLDQAIYADATHEVVVLDTLTAFNLTGLWSGPPLSTTENQRKNTFVASKVVPFATHFTTQVLECPAYKQPKQIRFLVNDAVVPINDSHPGCPADANGLCAFDTVIAALQKRSKEIDFEYDCFGDYQASVGVDYNGRAPRM